MECEHELMLDHINVTTHVWMKSTSEQFMKETKTNILKFLKVEITWSYWAKINDCIETQKQKHISW